MSVLRTGGVLLTHPGKHFHFYQIARAAADANLLNRFVTGLYFMPGTLGARLLQWVPGRAVKSFQHRFASRRRAPGVSDDAVESLPACELVAMGLDRIPVLRDMIGRNRQVLWKNALYDRKFAARVSRLKPDIVHCLWGCAWKTFVQARKAGAITVLDVMINPLAHQYVDGEYGHSSDKKSRMSRRECAEIALADYVFSPSDFVSDGVAAMGFPRDRIIHIPYGVQTERFTERKDRADDSFRILFVGQVALRKGFQYLLEAFKDLDLPKAELTIIGSPVDSVSEKVLRSYDGLFTWVPHVSYDELHRYYQATDIFAFPSLAEGSALVSYEALACGLPSIVTANVGSVIRDGIEGFIVPTRDPGALREKIRLLYHDKNLARRMGLAARARAENFTWKGYRDRIVDAYMEIYQRKATT